MSLEQIRRDYLSGGLRRNGLLENPFEQFNLWMEQAINAQIPDPTAMTLATVNESGEPSQRIVLLKQVDEQGFVFYTNYLSDKGQDILSNPSVSLHFPWHSMERQVRIGGLARRLDREVSERYFRSRPRLSQIAAWASCQSYVIEGRAKLSRIFDELVDQYEGKVVPLPDFWGGFVIKPHLFEFWQGGANRLHDRFRYRQADTNWLIERLAP